MKNFFTRNGIRLAGIGLATAAAGLILSTTKELTSEYEETENVVDDDKEEEAE